MVGKRTKLRWFSLKYCAPFLFAFFSLIALAFTTLSCDQNTSTLVGVGSNSISPIINKVKDEGLARLIYHNIGSTYGVRAMSASNIEYDFGTTSSTKVPTLEDETDGGLAAKTNWENNKIRTITFALDGVALGLNLPSELRNSFASAMPTVEGEQLALLYAGESKTWDELLSGDQSTIAGASNHVEPLAIVNGVNSSGKAETFIDKLLKNYPDQIKDLTTIDNFRTHDVATIKHQTLDDDNAAFSLNTSTENSIMYYSVGFIATNDLSAAKTNEKVITLSAVNFGNGIEVPSISNIQHGTYTWERPFNIAYPITNNLSLSLVDLLLSAEVQAHISALGFVALTLEQIALQRVTVPYNTVPDLGADGANENAGLFYGLRITTQWT